jgi:hypothetical protein
MILPLPLLLREHMRFCGAAAKQRRQGRQGRPTVSRLLFFSQSRFKGVSTSGVYEMCRVD